MYCRFYISFTLLSGSENEAFPESKIELPSYLTFDANLSGAMFCLIEPGSTC